jgi:hypothetical protein
MLLKDLFLDDYLAIRFIRWTFGCRGLLFGLCTLPRQDLAAMFCNLRTRALTTDAATSMHAANANAG